MSDRQERRRQLTRARVENWRACQDARGVVVARILYVADRPLQWLASLADHLVKAKLYTTHSDV